MKEFFPVIYCEDQIKVLEVNLTNYGDHPIIRTSQSLKFSDLSTLTVWKIFTYVIFKTQFYFRTFYDMIGAKTSRLDIEQFQIPLR